ncbi:ArsR/SmtB family transcription factor [Paenibacillus marinisediminis]
MKITVLQQPNTLVECVELLYRYTNHDEHRKLKENFVHKYNLDETDLNEPFAHIIALGEHVYHNLDVPQDRIDYFFTEKGHAKWTIAHLLLMNKHHLNVLNSEEQIKQIRSLTKQDVLTPYAKCLVDTISGVGGSTSLPDIKSEADLFHVIESLELEAQDKWLCMLIYQNFERYLKELLAILEQAIMLYEQKLSALQPMLSEFYTTYHKIAQHNPESLLQENFHIKLGPIEHIYVIPYIMGCNMLTSMNPEGQEESDTDYLFLGVLFEHLAASVEHVVSDEKLCKMLKSLSDTSKFAILKSIRNNSAYGQELAERLNLTTATISHHMNSLINSGFITIEKQANRIYYQMDMHRVKQFIEQLQTSLLNPDEPSKG